MNLGPGELAALVLVAVVLLGWKRLPDMARSVGRSMRLFKSEVTELKNDGKEGRPSPSATDTVPGSVVPPPSPTPTPPPTAAPAPAPAPPAPAEVHRQDRSRSFDNPAL